MNSPWCFLWNSTTSNETHTSWLEEKWHLPTLFFLETNVGGSYKKLSGRNSLKLAAVVVFVSHREPNYTEAWSNTLYICQNWTGQIPEADCFLPDNVNYGFTSSKCRRQKLKEDQNLDRGQKLVCNFLRARKMSMREKKNHRRVKK